MRPGLTQQEGGAKVLTLQDVVRTAEAQRRFPNWIVWAVVLVVAAWAIGTAVRAFPWQAAGSPAVQQEQQVQIGPAPAESNSAPARTEPEVIAPTATLLTLRWEEYDWEKNPLGLGEYYTWGLDAEGNIRNHMEGERLVELLGTGETKDAIVYTRPSSQDRIVESVYSPSPNDTRPQGAYKPGDIIKSTLPGYEFSPDQMNWFRAENYPDVPGLANIQGAVWDGKDILILANYQYEPWQYKHYVARVAPQDTKRASQ